MSSASDFVIENGVLKKYVGPGGDVVVPESVTEIGYEAFKYCSSLTSLAVPEGVTRIGNGAFADTGLTSITLPTTIETIGRGAFHWCEKLTEITLPENVNELAPETFAGCRGLISIVFPKALQTVKDHAFENCDNLVSIVLPDGVTGIGNSAFFKCTKLEHVHLPKSLKTIESDAFYNCESLKEITLPESMEKISEGAFTGSGLLAVSVPDALKNRTADFDIENGRLKKYLGFGGEVTIPDPVKWIEAKAFYGATTVTSVRFPNDLQGIDEEAFSNTRIQAKSLALPETVIELKNPGINADTLLRMTLKDAEALSGRVFRSVNVLLMLLTGQKAVICGNKYAACNLDGFGKDSFDWQKYDSNIVNNGPEFKMTAPYRLRAMLYRMLDPEGMTDEMRECYIALLTENAKKLIPVAEEDGEPAYVKLMIDVGAINGKNRKAVLKLLSASENPEIAAMAEKI